jgi:hypothetical protein
VRGWLNIGLTSMLLICAFVILASAFGKWLETLKRLNRSESVSALEP